MNSDDAYAYAKMRDLEKHHILDMENARVSERRISMVEPEPFANRKERRAYWSRIKALARKNSKNKKRSRV